MLCCPFAKALLLQRAITIHNGQSEERTENAEIQRTAAMRAVPRLPNANCRVVQYKHDGTNETNELFAKLFFALTTSELYLGYCLVSNNSRSERNNHPSGNPGTYHETPSFSACGRFVGSRNGCVGLRSSQKYVRRENRDGCRLANLRLEKCAYDCLPDTQAS